MSDGAPLKRPRGRPRKPAVEIEKGGVGRPQVPLRQDPDRYAIALFFALDADPKTSERKAAMLAAIFTEPISLCAPSPPAIEKAQKEGLLSFGLQSRVNFRKGGLASVATRIRNKAKAVQARGALAKGQFQIDDASWLKNMALAFLCALRAKDPLAKNFAVIYGEAAGEREYVVSTIIPEIDAKLSGKIPFFFAGGFFGEFISQAKRINCDY